jgi:hypothetical protein
MRVVNIPHFSRRIERLPLSARPPELCSRGGRQNEDR